MPSTKLHTTLGGHRLDPKKIDYTFLGQSVGRSCLCTLLAIGKSRFSKILSLKPDLRIGKSKSGSQRSSWSVDAFLSILYNGVAETLPDKLLDLADMICTFLVFLQFNMFLTSSACLRFIRRGRSSGQGDSDLDIEFDSDHEDDVMREWLDSPGKGPIWDMVASEKKVAKFLDPGTVSDLYHHYVATRQMWGAAAVSCPDICSAPVSFFQGMLCGSFQSLHASAHQPAKVWYLPERLQYTLARYSEIPAPKFDACLNVVCLICEIILKMEACPF